MAYRECLRAWESGQDPFATQLSLWLMEQESLPAIPLTPSFFACRLPAKLWLLIGLCRLFGRESISTVGPLLKRTWNGLWNVDASITLYDGQTAQAFLNDVAKMNLNIDIKDCIAGQVVFQIRASKENLIDVYRSIFQLPRVQFGTYPPSLVHSTPATLAFLKSDAALQWIKQHHGPFKPQECALVATKMHDWFVFYERLSLQNRNYWDAVIWRLQLAYAQTKATLSNQEVEFELVHWRRIKTESIQRKRGPFIQKLRAKLQRKWIREHRNNYIKRIWRKLRARRQRRIYDAVQQRAQRIHRENHISKLRAKMRAKWTFHQSEHRTNHIANLRRRMQSRYQKRVHDAQTREARRRLQQLRWQLIRETIALKTARRKIIANMILEHVKEQQTRVKRNLKCKQRKLKRAKAKIDAESAFQETCQILEVWRSACIMDMYMLRVGHAVLNVALPCVIQTKNAMLSAMLSIPKSEVCQDALREDIAALRDVLQLLNNVINVNKPMGKPLRTALGKLMDTNWKNEELSKEPWAPWLMGERRVQMACSRLKHKLTMYQTPQLNSQTLDSQTLRDTPPRALNCQHVRDWLRLTKAPKYLAVLEMCMFHEVIDAWAKSQCTAKLDGALNHMAMRIAEIAQAGADMISIKGQGCIPLSKTLLTDLYA